MEHGQKIKCAEWLHESLISIDMEPSFVVTGATPEITYITGRHHLQRRASPVNPRDASATASGRWSSGPMGLDNIWGFPKVGVAPRHP